MPTRNVNLSDHYDQFIEASIASGRFTNASEAVRAGLHLLERQQAEDKAKLEWLRGAVQTGLDAIDRGDYLTFESVDDLADHIEAIGDEVSQEITAERTCLNRTHASG